MVCLASARPGVRLGVSTGAALWRTVSDSVLAGGGSRTAVRARGRGLHTCAWQGSAASNVRTGSRFRDGDVCIPHIGGGGDPVAGFGLACSLVGRSTGRLVRGDTSDT